MPQREPAAAGVHGTAHDSDALEWARQELKDFVYHVSHDLKEPLRGIRSFSAFLLEDYEAVLDEEGQAKLRTLVRLAQRTELMLQGLVQISRVAQVELTLTPTPLQPLIDDLLETLQPKLAEAGAQVRIPSALPSVRCDADKIATVYGQLIANAIQYSDAAQKWAELGFDEPTAPDRGSGAPRCVNLWVRDNGIGIQPQFVRGVFELFRRIPGSDKYGPGTGTGMFLAQKILERHGSELHLESTFGTGSRFSFSLPMSGDGPGS